MATATRSREVILDLSDPCFAGEGCYLKGWSVTATGLSICGQCRRPSTLYLEKMMTITATSSAAAGEVTTGKPCGFCMTNNHANCSYGVKNGSGAVILCGCMAEAPAAPRAKRKTPASPDEVPWHLPSCVDCRRRTMEVRTTTGTVLPAADVDPATSRCADPADCLRYREERASRAGYRLVGISRNFDEGGGQGVTGDVGSSHQQGRQPRAKAARGTTTGDTVMSESAFRVKAGGSKGTAVVEAIKDSKNHGLSRAQLAEKVGCTTGRIGEVIRFELAEGDAATKKAVQAFLDAVPSRKAADKPVAKKTTTKKATSKATATKKAAAKPATKKTAAKPVAKKAVAKKA